MLSDNQLKSEFIKNILLFHEINELIYIDDTPEYYTTTYNPHDIGIVKHIISLFSAFNMIMKLIHVFYQWLMIKSELFYLCLPIAQLMKYVTMQH